MPSWGQSRQASGCCRCASPPPSALGVILRPPHLLLIALQESDEEAGDSTGCGIHLGETHAQREAPGRG